MTVARRAAGMALPLILLAQGAGAKGFVDEGWSASSEEVVGPSELRERVMAYLRGRAGPGLDESATPGFGGIAVCLVPEKGDVPSFVVVKGRDVSSSMTALLMARALHGYGGSWGADAFARERQEEIACAGKTPFADPDDKDVLGRYNTQIRLSVIRASEFIGETDTVYHENTHHVFNVYNRIMIDRMVVTGHDAAAFHTLDEANARARAYLAWMHRWIKTSHTELRSLFEKEALQKSEPLPGLHQAFTQLYGENELRSYVKENGRFPELLHRITLLAFLERLADVELYKKAAATLADAYMQKPLSVDDNAISAVMAYDGNVYGIKMTGIAGELKAHPFLAEETGPAAQAKPAELVGKILQYLDVFTISASCAAYRPENSAPLFPRVNAAEYQRLSSPFVRPLVEGLFDVARTRLYRNTAMDEAYKAKVLNHLDVAQDYLVGRDVAGHPPALIHRRAAPAFMCE